MVGSRDGKSPIKMAVLVEHALEPLGLDPTINSSIWQTLAPHNDVCEFCCIVRQEPSVLKPSMVVTFASVTFTTEIKSFEVYNEL